MSIWSKEMNKTLFKKFPFYYSYSVRERSENLTDNLAKQSVNKDLGSFYLETIELN